MIQIGQLLNAAASHQYTDVSKYTANPVNREDNPFLQTNKMGLWAYPQDMSCTTKVDGQPEAYYINDENGNLCEGTRNLVFWA